LHRIMKEGVRHRGDAGQEAELDVREVQGRERGQFERPTLADVRRIEEDEGEPQPDIHREEEANLEGQVAGAQEVAEPSAEVQRPDPLELTLQPAPSG